MQYVTSIKGTPSFLLIDMGYTYPVLLVRSNGKGESYDIVAFAGGKVYRIDSVGAFPAYISYGNGFIFHWFMIGSLYYQGYVIADLVNCFQNGVRNPSSNPQCYQYNLSADEDGTYNSLDPKMSDADATAQLDELNAKRQTLTTPFSYAADVDQINNTNLDYIRNWS